MILVRKNIYKSPVFAVFRRKKDDFGQETGRQASVTDL
jgi:hypothetical protein